MNSYESVNIRIRNRGEVSLSVGVSFCYDLTVIGLIAEDPVGDRDIASPVAEYDHIAFFKRSGIDRLGIDQGADRYSRFHASRQDAVAGVAGQAGQGQGKTKDDGRDDDRGADDIKNDPERGPGLLFCHKGLLQVCSAVTFVKIIAHLQRGAVI